MKKTLTSLLCILLIGLFTQCKKDDDLPQAQVNTVLYNQPDSVIKKYISGKWILHYAYGGITGHIKQEYTNSYIEFKFGTKDSIIRKISGIIDVNSPIKWVRDRDIITGDSIYLAGFTHNTTGLQFAYRIEGIHNDTLVIDDPACDGFGYALTRY